MEGDMMGGPFVSHAHLDEKNQRVVVAEPSFMPRVRKSETAPAGEASLYTFCRIDGKRKGRGEDG